MISVFSSMHSKKTFEKKFKTLTQKMGHTSIYYIHLVDEYIILLTGNNFIIHFGICYFDQNKTF